MAAKGGKRTLFARAVNLPNAAPPIEYETDVRTKCVLGHVSDMNFCFRVGWHGVPMTSEIDSPFAFLPPDPNFVAIESLPAHPAMRESFRTRGRYCPSISATRVVQVQRPVVRLGSPRWVREGDLRPRTVVGHRAGQPSILS